MSYLTEATQPSSKGKKLNESNENQNIHVVLPKIFLRKDITLTHNRVILFCIQN